MTILQQIKTKNINSAHSLVPPSPTATTTSTTTKYYSESSTESIEELSFRGHGSYERRVMVEESINQHQYYWKTVGKSGDVKEWDRCYNNTTNPRQSWGAWDGWAYLSSRPGTSGGSSSRQTRWRSSWTSSPAHSRVVGGLRFPDGAPQWGRNSAGTK